MTWFLFFHFANFSENDVIFFNYVIFISRYQKGSCAYFCWRLHDFMIFLTSSLHCKHVGQKFCLPFPQNPAHGKSPWILPKIRQDSPAVGCTAVLGPSTKSSFKSSSLLNSAGHLIGLARTWSVSLRRWSPSRWPLRSFGTRQLTRTSPPLWRQRCQKSPCADPRRRARPHSWRFWDALRNDVFPCTSHALLRTPKIWPVK